MQTSSQFIIARQDATILTAARSLCDMYAKRFSDAAGNSADKSDIYLLAKTSQAFAMAEVNMRECIAIARILADQDALK